MPAGADRGKLVQVLDGSHDLLVGLLEMCSRLAAGRPLGKGPPLRQAGGKHVQALPGALAEPSLEAPSLLVADLDQAAARRDDLGDLRSNLSLEPGVGGGQPGCRPDRLEQSRIVQDGRVVHEDGERTAVHLEGRHRSVRSRPGDIEGATPGVHVAAGLGEPVAYLEGRVPQRAGEGVPQRP